MKMIFLAIAIVILSILAACSSMPSADARLADEYTALAGSCTATGLLYAAGSITKADVAKAVEAAGVTRLGLDSAKSLEDLTPSAATLQAASNAATACSVLAAQP